MVGVATKPAKSIALIGRKEAAGILGVAPPNLDRITMPPSMQERGIDGFEVSSGPLWPREEIEKLAAERKRATALRAGGVERCGSGGDR
jgi:hypothetical protein